MSLDAAGWPNAISDATAAQLRAVLATGTDTFVAANVMSIVVQLDKSLVNVGANTTVAAWASTHEGS